MFQIQEWTDVELIFKQSRFKKRFFDFWSNQDSRMIIFQTSKPGRRISESGRRINQEHRRRTVI